MKNGISLVVATFLVNVWINYAIPIPADGDWSRSVTGRLLVLACLAMIALLITYYRRDNVVARAAFRGALVILVALGINAVPFLLYGDGINLDPTGSGQSPARNVSEVLTPHGIFSILQSEGDLRRASETEKVRYEAALNQCLHEKMDDLHYKENAARFECVSNASRMGRAAFVTLYASKTKRIGPS